MKLSATLKSTVVALGALLLSVALGAPPAVAQKNVTVSIENAEAQAGSAVDVPVQVTNFDNVGSLRLVVNYDDQAISFPDDASTSDLISGAPRANFTANVNASGELIISWFDGTGNNPINLGNGTLLDLTFSNFSGGSTDVTFDGESEITDAEANTIGATFQGGVVAENISELAVGSVQDAGLNQTVSVPLSGQNLDNVGSASLEVSFDTEVLQFEQIANDNSGLNLNASADNGVVTLGGFNSTGTSLGSDFVELEFKFYGGSSNLEVLSRSEVTDAQSNGLPVEFADGSIGGDNPTVSIPDQAAATGETITVPLQATDLQAMGSASIDVTYNAASLTFNGSSNGIQGFNLSVEEPQNGVVRIGGFSSTGVDPADNAGRIVDLQFTVDATSGSETQLGFDAASEITNSSSTPYNMTFSGGRVVLEETSIDLSDQSLTYDVTTIDSTSTREITITNTSSQVATLSGSVTLPMSDKPFAVAGGAGDFSLAPNETRTVTIDYTPTEVSNPDQDTLEISHNADNMTSPIEVPLEGAAEAPQLAVSPESVTYNVTTIDSTSERVVTVTNNATDVATLSGSVTLPASDKPFSVTAGSGDFELGPGESTDVTVQYAPTEESNPDQDTLEVSSNVGSASVPLEGTAEAPSIAAQLEPDTASVRSEEQLTLTQTVTNEATEVAALEATITSVPDFLTLESASITSGGGRIDGQSLTLQPGSEAEVTYAFQEDVSSTTVFEGQISHKTNDPAAPTVDLPVQITATAAQIAVDPSTLGFGTVPVGTDSTRTVTVENTNGATLTVDSVRTRTDTFAVGSAAAGGFTVAGGDSQSVEVTYGPESASESNTDTLEIYHQGDNMASPIEVPLEGAAEVLSISEARGEGPGATVTIDGKVTRDFGSYVRIQDESGATGASGLVIRQTSGGLSSAFQEDISDGTIAQGTQLQVTGTLSEFNGLLQINNEDLSDYAVQGQDALPQAQNVELSTLSAEGEDYESELVQIDSLTFVNPDTTEGTLNEGLTYKVEGPSGTTFDYRVQGASETAVIGAPINPGMFTYTGVVGEFRGTFQLIPIRTSTGLPVELASFEGTSVKQNEESAVRLTWRTASETNNAGFQVQRKKVDSGDGWTTIGHREGAGTTTEVQTYRFTDTDLLYSADTLTYRLRQMDLDGTAHVSTPITITRGSPEGMELLGTYPNPAQNRAVVRFAVPEKAEEQVRLSLYDVMGREVRSMQVDVQTGRHKRSVDVSRLASGVYFLRLSADDVSPKTQKITVVR